MAKPKSLYPEPEKRQFNVNIALIVLMSILFGFVLALIGFAFRYYPVIGA